jgi:hypothetical protein
MGQPRDKGKGDQFFFTAFSIRSPIKTPTMNRITRTMIPMIIPSAPAMPTARPIPPGARKVAMRPRTSPRTTPMMSPFLRIPQRSCFPALKNP